MTLFHIKMTFMNWMSWFFTKMIYFSKGTTLVEVNDDERMKTNTYVLLSLTYERCTGLCHEYYLKDENFMGLMHFVCTYTSWYFPIYDDEYERVSYDDNDHASHETQWSVDLWKSLRTASLTMMGLGGGNLLGIHTRICGLCVGFHIQFLSELRPLLWEF